MILYIRKGTCSDLHGIPEPLQQANSRTAACVRNSMKFKINVFNIMATCSTRGKKLIRTSKYKMDYLQINTQILT